jgi:hypothetical protein
MALIVLAAMAALIILAVRLRRSKPFFAVTLGVLTAMIVPLYRIGDVPLKARLVFGLLAGWPWLVVTIAVAIVVYGGTALLVHLYVKTSGDIRRTKIIYSIALGAMVSGLVYNVLLRFFARGANLSYGQRADLLGIGALVALTVAFALTHERRPGTPFFESRDGGTVMAAIVGAAVAIGGLSIAIQQLPGPYYMSQLVTNVLIGGLLGAGLTIPLRAVKANRVLGAALGGLIGGLITATLMKSAVGAAPLQGLVIGVTVGALLPPEMEEEPVPPQLEGPETEGSEGPEGAKGS